MYGATDYCPPSSALREIIYTAVIYFVFQTIQRHYHIVSRTRTVCYLKMYVKYFFVSTAFVVHQLRCGAER